MGEGEVLPLGEEQEYLLGPALCWRRGRNTSDSGFQCLRLRLPEIIRGQPSPISYHHANKSCSGILLREQDSDLSQG